MAIENCNKSSISIKRVKSTKIGLKETESNKACTRLIRKKSYELVWFLRSCKVQCRILKNKNKTWKVRWIENGSLLNEI